MRVIHGIWAQGALCLWAEDPDLPRVPGSASRRAGVPPVPGPHPFASQASELADLLARLPGPAADAARKAVDDELTLQLPSAGRAPLASPELIRPEGDPAGRVTLASWRVPVLAFSPAAALDVLGGLAPLAPLAPLDYLGDPVAVAGGSLPYLAAVARFAADLAVRGRVLPVLTGQDGAYAARWRPVLGGADAQRGHDLAAAMPPSCRAGGQAPGPLLADALESLTDAAARSRLTAPLLPARRGRTPARIPIAERFVAARCPDTGGPGPHLLPADRARRARRTGRRSLAGRVRAAVRRGPQPDDLRRGRVGGPRLRIHRAGPGFRRHRSRRGAAGRAGRGGQAVRRDRRRAAGGGPGRGRAGHAGRVPVPEGDRAAAFRRRVRRAVARLGAQGPPRAEADHPVAGHVRLVGHRSQVRP